MEPLGPFVYPHFQAFGKNFTLYLRQNHDLLANEFMVEKTSMSREINDIFKRKNEDREIRKSCHYVGKVKGYLNSSVAVNICNGLVRFILINTIFSPLFRNKLYLLHSFSFNRNYI